MTETELKPGQFSWRTLSDALFTPDLKQFGQWAFDVLEERPAEYALRIVLRALYKPLANLVGGPKAAAELADREIARLADGGISKDEVGALILGTLQGFRLGQITAGCAVLVGARLTADAATMLESDVQITADYGRPESWIGLTEGSLMPYNEKDDEGESIIKSHIEKIEKHDDFLDKIEMGKIDPLNRKPRAEV